MAQIIVCIFSVCPSVLRLSLYKFISMKGIKSWPYYAYMTMGQTCPNPNPPLPLCPGVPNTPLPLCPGVAYTPLPLCPGFTKTSLPICPVPVKTPLSYRPIFGSTPLSSASVSINPLPIRPTDKNTPLPLGESLRPSTLKICKQFESDLLVGFQVKFWKGEFKAAFTNDDSTFSQIFKTPLPCQHILMEVCHHFWSLSSPIPSSMYWCDLWKITQLLRKFYHLSFQFHEPFFQPID